MIYLQQFRFPIWEREDRLMMGNIGYKSDMNFYVHYTIKTHHHKIHLVIQCYLMMNNLNDNNLRIIFDIPLFSILIY